MKKATEYVYVIAGHWPWLNEQLIKTQQVCTKKAHCVYRSAHTVGHSIYFVAAWAEGHGVYAMISLFLLGMMWAGIVLKEEVE